jgi:hypothetical protein
VCGESPVSIVSGHELPPTDRRAASQTRWAFSAGDHCGDDYRSPKPAQSVITCGHDSPGDFVTQNQRKKMARGHAIEGKTDICVTDPTSRYLYDHFATLGFKSL